MVRCPFIVLEIVGDTALSEGEVVARRYRLDRVVGEGGMGTVWAATHLVTGKLCALKFLQGERGADPRSHRRLLEEARASCRIRHPNVCVVHDVLELDNGTPFLVMDLLDGESLATRIARVGRLDLAETLRIAVPLVSALEAAHAMGVVHRDVKPDNVFLECAGGVETVRVLDFGIAKQVLVAESTGGFRNASLAGTITVAGTPEYMPPEQALLGGKITPAADAFALGALLHECLLGGVPARENGTFRVDRSRVEAALRGRVPPLPPGIAALVVALLGDAPRDRPPLAEVMRQLVAPAPTSHALAATDLFAATLPVGELASTAPPTRTLSLSALATPSRSAPSDVATARSSNLAPHRATRWSMLGAIALLVLGAAVTAAFVSRQNASRSAQAASRGPSVEVRVAHVSPPEPATDPATGRSQSAPRASQRLGGPPKPSGTTLASATATPPPPASPPPSPSSTLSPAPAPTPNDSIPTRERN